MKKGCLSLLLFMAAFFGGLGWLYYGPWNMDHNLVWGQDVFVASPKRIAPRQEITILAYEDDTCKDCRTFVFDKVPEVIGPNVGYYVRNLDDVNPNRALDAEKEFSEVCETAAVAKRSNPNGLFLVSDDAEDSVRPVPLFAAYYREHLVAAVQVSGETDSNWPLFKDWLEKAPAGLPETMDPGFSASSESLSGLPDVWQFRKVLTIGSKPEAGNAPLYYVSAYGLLWPDEWPTVKLNPLKYWGWKTVPVFNWSVVSSAGCTKWIPWTFSGITGQVCETWKNAPEYAPRIQVPFRESGKEGHVGNLLIPSDPNQQISVRGPSPEDTEQVYWRLIEFVDGPKNANLLWVPLVRVTIMTPEGPMANVAVPKWDLEWIGTAEDMFESPPAQQAVMAPSPTPTDESSSPGPPAPQPVAEAAPTPEPVLGEVKSGLLVRNVAQPGEEGLTEEEKESLWVFLYENTWNTEAEAEVTNKVASGGFRVIYKEVIGTRFFKMVSLTSLDGSGENTDLAGSYGLIENIGPDPLQPSQ